MVGGTPFRALWKSATSAARPSCGRRWVALSLGGLRRKIEALLLPAEVEIVLHLDGLAERERHRRQA